MDERNFISRDQFVKEIKEYKDFLFSSNLFAMALSLLSAQTIQKFVSTISDTIFMPIINYLVNKTGGNWRNLIFVPVDGMNIELGKLLGGALEFVITITFVYLIYTKIMKRINPETKI